MRFLFFTFHFSLFTIISFSQTISSSLDRNKILLGEQVTLLLKADISEANYSLTGWFNFPDTINHLEVVRRSAIDTVETNGSLSLLQNITITHLLIQVCGNCLHCKLLFRIKQANKLVIKADTLSLQVLPVDVSNMQDYHDIKSIIQVEAKNNFWLPLILAVLAISIIGLFSLVVAEKKKEKK